MAECFAHHKHLISVSTAYPQNLGDCSSLTSKVSCYSHVKRHRTYPHFCHFEDRKGQSYYFLQAGSNFLYILSSDGIQVTLLVPEVVKLAELVQIKKELCFIIACDQNIYCLKIQQFPKKSRRTDTSENHEDIFNELLEENKDINVQEDNNVQTVSVTVQHKILSGTKVIGISCSPKYLVTLEYVTSGLLLKTYSLENILHRNSAGDILLNTFIPCSTQSLQNEEFTKLCCLMNASYKFSNVPVTAKKVSSQLFKSVFGETTVESGFLLCSEGGAVYRIDHSTLDNKEGIVAKTGGYTILYHIRQNIAGVITSLADPNLEVNDAVFIVGSYGKLLYIASSKNGDTHISEHTIAAPVLSICSRKNMISHSTGQELHVHRLNWELLEDEKQLQFSTTSYMYENVIGMDIGLSDDEMVVLNKHGDVLIIELAHIDKNDCISNTGSSDMKDLLTSITQVSEEITKSKQMSDEQDHSLKQLAISNAQCASINKTDGKEILDWVICVDQEISGRKAKHILKVTLTNAQRLDFSGTWGIIVTACNMYQLASVSRSVKFSNIHQEQCCQMLLPLDNILLENLPLDLHLILSISIEVPDLNSSHRINKQFSIPLEHQELGVLHFLTPVSHNKELSCTVARDFVSAITESKPTAALYADELTAPKDTKNCSVLIPRMYLIVDSSVKEVSIMTKLMKEMCGLNNIEQQLSGKLYTPRNRNIILNIHKETNDMYEMEVQAVLLVDMCQVLMAAEVCFMPHRIKEILNFRKDQPEALHASMKFVLEKLAVVEGDLHIDNRPEEDLLQELFMLYKDCASLYIGMLSKGPSVITVE